MLPKGKRIEKDLFQKTTNSNKVISTPLFVFKFIKNNKPKYSFVAPKAIFKLATKRNKFKRIGYNTLRNERLPSYTGIFIFKKSTLTSNKKDIELSIVEIIKKLR